MPEHGNPEHGNPEHGMIDREHRDHADHEGGRDHEHHEDHQQDHGHHRDMPWKNASNCFASLSITSMRQECRIWLMKQEDAEKNSNASVNTSMATSQKTSTYSIYLKSPIGRSTHSISDWTRSNANCRKCVDSCTNVTNNVKRRSELR